MTSTPVPHLRNSASVPDVCEWISVPSFPDSASSLYATSMNGFGILYAVSVIQHLCPTFVIQRLYYTQFLWFGIHTQLPTISNCTRIMWCNPYTDLCHSAILLYAKSVSQQLYRSRFTWFSTSNRFLSFIPFLYAKSASQNLYITWSSICSRFLSFTMCKIRESTSVQIRKSAYVADFCHSLCAKFASQHLYRYVIQYP